LLERGAEVEETGSGANEVAKEPDNEVRVANDPTEATGKASWVGPIAGLCGLVAFVVMFFGLLSEKCNYRSAGSGSRAQQW
jgi:hypothetical protein